MKTMGMVILVLALIGAPAAHTEASQASQIQRDPPEGWPTGTNRLDDATLARKLDEVADAAFRQSQSQVRRPSEEPQG